MSKTHEYKGEEKKFPESDNIKTDDPAKVIEAIQKSLSQEGPAIIRQAQNEDIVVFVGNTRGGKSTLVNHVMGNKLKVIEDEDSFKPIIVKAFPDPKDMLGPKIGSSAMAETTVPKKWMGPKMIIWDCPGFGDNRGIDQDIINAFYVKELLSHANSVKFVLVSAFDELNVDNIKQFTDLIKGVGNMLPNLPQLIEGISIVFTKVGLNFKDENIPKLLFNKLIKSGIPIESAGKELIQYFVNNPKSIGVFKEQAKEGDLPLLTLDSSIIQSIKHGTPVTHDKLVDITPNISEASEIFLRKHYDAISGAKEIKDLISKVNEICIETLKTIKSRIEIEGISKESLKQVRNEALATKKIVEKAIAIAIGGEDDKLIFTFKKIGELDNKIKSMMAEGSPLLSKLKFLKFLDQVIKPESGQSKLHTSEVFINIILSTLYNIKRDTELADIDISLKLSEGSTEEARNHQILLDEKYKAKQSELEQSTKELEKINKEIVDTDLNFSDHISIAWESPWTTTKAIGKGIYPGVLSAMLCGGAVVSAPGAVIAIAGIALLAIGAAIAADEGEGAREAGGVLTSPLTLPLIVPSLLSQELGNDLKEGIDKCLTDKKAPKLAEITKIQEKKASTEKEQKELNTKKELNEKLQKSNSDYQEALKELQKFIQIEKQFSKAEEDAKTPNEKAKAAEELTKAKLATLQKLQEVSKIMEQYEGELSKLDEIEKRMLANADKNNNEQEIESGQEISNQNAGLSSGSLTKDEVNTVVHLHLVSEGDTPVDPQNMGNAGLDNVEILGNAGQSVPYDLD